MSDFNIDFSANDNEGDASLVVKFYSTILNVATNFQFENELIVFDSEFFII